MRPFTINSRSFDGRIKRSWKGELMEIDGSRLTFIGEFDQTVEHPELGIIHSGTVSHEYFWTDRWYSIFRFVGPDGSFRNFYCNINMPPSISGEVLDFVDLDIDIVVVPDGEVQVLDEDEYEQNARDLGYGEDVLTAVEEARRELKRMIGEREFPFDILEQSQPKLRESVLIDDQPDEP